jgi:hypothetical protein
MVSKRSILGAIVTAYEITPNRAGSGPKPAERDDETVRQLYELLLEESNSLANSIKSASAITVKPKTSR